MNPSDKDQKDSRNRPGGRGGNPADGPIIDLKATRVADAPKAEPGKPDPVKSEPGKPATPAAASGRPGEPTKAAEMKPADVKPGATGQAAAAGTSGPTAKPFGGGTGPTASTGSSGPTGATASATPSSTIARRSHGAAARTRPALRR